MTVNEKIAGLYRAIKELSIDVGNSYTARGLGRRQCRLMIADLKKYGKCVNVSDNVEWYIKIGSQCGPTPL